MALSAYRHLLRATRIAFNGNAQEPQNIALLTLAGDTPLLHSARQQARQGFEKGRSLEPESTEAAKAVEHALGVSQILLHNIVQGRQVDGAQDSYKLELHEHTERGYNDTVKNPRAPGGYVKVGC